MTTLTTSALWRPSLILPLSLLFRLLLLLYGRWQDHNSPFKYTDIDYLVFTDAARYVARSHSPYDRATYRYTPLLAWLLLPTTWSSSSGNAPSPSGTAEDAVSWWFESGKALFAAGDVLTGALLFLLLRDYQKLASPRALRYAAIWLLNPMVANISTRGSSEGLLAVLVVGVLWAALTRRIALAGVLLGAAVHLKIYPFVYAASLFWWLGREGELELEVQGRRRGVGEVVVGLLNRDRVVLTVTSAVTFVGLNVAMYSM